MPWVVGRAASVGVEVPIPPIKFNAAVATSNTYILWRY